METRDVNCRLGLYTSTFFKRGREGEKAAGIIKVLGKNFINLTDSPRVSGEEGRKASAQEKPPSLPSPLFQLLFLAEWERERVNGRGEHRGQVREPDYVDQVFTANSVQLSIKPLEIILFNRTLIHSPMIRMIRIGCLDPFEKEKSFIIPSKQNEKNDFRKTNSCEFSSFLALSKIVQDP